MRHVPARLWWAGARSNRDLIEVISTTRRRLINHSACARSLPSWQTNRLHSLAAELNQLPAPRDDEAADSMGQLLPKLWSVRCRNSTKEVFWRLAVNALPTADRIPEAACICNGADPPHCTRAHIFWQCPMAQVVVSAVQSELQAWSQRQQQQPAAAAAAAAAGAQAPPAGGGHMVGTPTAGGVWRRLAAGLPLCGVCL